MASMSGPASSVRLKSDDRRAKFSAEETVSKVTTLDDLDVTRQTEAEIAPQSNKKRSKMEIAKEFEQKTTADIAEMMKGIDEEISKLGVTISTASKYQGREKFWNLIGQKERADAHRLQRLKGMSLQENLDKLKKLYSDAIDGFGRLEARHIGDVKKFNDSLALTLSRYKEAQPIYKVWRDKRKELEVELNALDLDLKAGTISEEERPAKEAELDNLKKQLHDAEIQENAHLAIVTDAQREIPSVQDARDGAQKQIAAIHTQRISMREKLNNTKVMIETAMTDVITTAELDRVNIVDPAYNKLITMISENKEKTLGATLEVVAERLGKAPIDPAKRLELYTNILGHIAAFTAKMDEIATEAERGTRVSQGNGTGAELSDFDGKQ